MALDYSKITIGPVVSKFAHLTRSTLAQQLMEAEERNLGETVSVPFDGDGNMAHRKTMSIRRTMARHGRRLYYTRTEGALLLWAKQDDSIDPTAYITKPRRKN